MNRYLIFSIIIAITAIISIAIVFIANRPFYFKSEGNCSIISKNEGGKKANVVFLTENIGEETIKKNIDFLLNASPYYNYKNRFNFFYAGEADCQVVQDFLFCYSKELLKKSAACPNDYIVVLSNQSSPIRSSAYINVISLNVNNPKSIILHEFGHIFANLADEYVPSIIPLGAKNCRKKCSDFNDIDGCFEGCSEVSYKRSSESSLMRLSNSDDYKKLNTLLIEKRLNKYE